MREMLKSPHQLVARRRTGEGNLSRRIDHAEVGEHVEEQIFDCDSGIEHDGRTRARLELLKQRPTQERLAGAGCTCHDDEPSRCCSARRTSLRALMCDWEG